jgi:hypothetical protein
MPGHGKLLIIERLLPEQIEPDDARAQAGFLADLNMMLTPGGQERTEAEYRRLLELAGLRFNHIVRTSSVSDVVEAELI